MYITLKRSRIINWWVGTENEKMSFFNIFKNKKLNERLLVIGYLEGGKRELASSSNYVVKITEDGVITAKGTFYPFEEAHEVYLQFLIEANKENVILASRWKWISKNIKNIMEANIIDGNIRIDKQKFDFIPKKTFSGVILTGYSTMLRKNIVLSPFTEGDYCLTLGIPQKVKNNIYNSSFEYEEESEERLEIVKGLFNDRIQNTSIKVKF